jgi:hypothetical protein
VRENCKYAGVNSSSGCNGGLPEGGASPGRMKTAGVNALNFLQRVGRGEGRAPERDKTAGVNCFMGQANAFSTESGIRWRMRGVRGPSHCEANAFSTESGIRWRMHRVRGPSNCQAMQAH